MEKSKKLTVVQKKKLRIHICSKCVTEAVWDQNRCPLCGSIYFYPYFKPVLSKGDSCLI